MALIESLDDDDDDDVVDASLDDDDDEEDDDVDDPLAKDGDLEVRDSEDNKE